MLVINSIEKARLSADSYSYSGTGVAWRARLVLFLGFALLAGGLAGSVVGRARARNGMLANSDAGRHGAQVSTSGRRLASVVRRGEHCGERDDNAEVDHCPIWEDEANVVQYGNPMDFTKYRGRLHI